MGSSGMAAPPAKRQKRMTVSSSDDDSEDTEAEHKTSPLQKIGPAKGSNNGLRSDSVSVASNERLKQKPSGLGKNIHASNRPNPKKVLTNTENHTSKDTRTKPIYAFFNARTHAQTHQVDSPRAKAVTTDEDDAIQDDLSDLGGPLAFRAKQEETSCTSRNEPSVLASKSMENAGGISRSSDPSRKHPAAAGNNLASCSRIAPYLSDIEESRPWAEKYPPTSIDELAVHKRKIADIRAWLNSALCGTDGQARKLIKSTLDSGSPY